MQVPSQYMCSWLTNSINTYMDNKTLLNVKWCESLKASLEYRFETGGFMPVLAILHTSDSNGVALLKFAHYFNFLM